MTRSASQIGKANRRNGRETERKVRDHLRQWWPELDYTHAGGPTRSHADDRGDLAPLVDRDGDHWTIEVKGPRAQPPPGEVERWAAEAAREASHAGAPLWVLIVRRPRCADVGRWWAYLPTWAMRGWISGIGPAVRRSVWAYDPASHPDDLVQMPLRQWVALVAPDQEATA